MSYKKEGFVIRTVQVEAEIAESISRLPHGIRNSACAGALAALVDLIKSKGNSTAVEVAEGKYKLVPSNS